MNDSPNLKAPGEAAAHHPFSSQTSPNKTDTRYALELDDFSFTHPDCEKPVLHRLSLSVPKGSFTLLTGPTGCGKTTLLKCCKPELHPSGKQEGAIRLFGRDASSLPAIESAQLVGYVSQSPENQAICSEVWHELAFGLENLGMPVDRMRRRVAEVAHFLGLNAWLHQEVATLSGGQKQLLNLASVLAMRPKLLLLDEPTSQLDPVAARTFLHALFRVNREAGITVMVATHSPELMVDYATHCIRLGGKTGEDTDTQHDPAQCSDAIFVPLLKIGPSSRDAKVSALTVSECKSTSLPKQARASFAVAPQHTNDALSRRAKRGVPSQRARNSANARPITRNLSSHPVIAVKNATFAYGKDAEPVLRDCNLEVAKASIHALVGGNGCGKTTLLKLAAGLLSPQRGRVRNTLIDQQAFVPQDPKALFICDTVLDELGEWAIDSSAIDSTLETLRLADSAQLHPYDLSGGQQQLLALGKVLLARPQLLVLDEPTKGLDPETKLQVAQLLDNARAQGIITLMSTHDLSFISCLADQVTMLFDGQDACTEPTDEFFAGNLFFKPTPNEFTQLWDEQLARILGADDE